MILPNFTVTDEVSTGDKSGSVIVNEFEIIWNLVDGVICVEAQTKDKHLGFLIG